MSIEAISWASKQSLPPRDKFVLVALCDHYNRDQDAAWMKQETLAAWTGYGRDTVQHALDALEHTYRVIVSETRRYADGRNAAKVYRIPALNPRVGAAHTATPTRVGETHTDRVGHTHTDRVGETHNKNHELRTVNTNPRPTPPTPPTTDLAERKPTAPTAPTPAEAFLEVWNLDCGPLPNVRSLNPTRRAAIARLCNEHGADALELFRDAVRCIAQDDHYIRHGFGLDSLLRPGRVQTRAEQFAANRGMTAGDRKLATTANAIANAIGGLQ